MPKSLRPARWRSCQMREEIADHFTTATDSLAPCPAVPAALPRPAASHELPVLACDVCAVVTPELRIDLPMAAT